MASSAEAPSVIPTEHQLREAFRLSQMSDGNGHKCNKGPKLTTEEAKKFTNAFQQIEFRELLADYVAEISDPKNRAEQDAYIKKLEDQNSIPDGKTILRPSPGFVMKFQYTKTGRSTQKGSIQNDNSSKSELSFDNSKNKSPESEEKKMFVNIVFSDEIGVPSCKVCKDGNQWSVPYSLGPMRMENDKKNSLTATFDCCFHPSARDHASTLPGFERLLAQTACEGVVEIFKSTKELVEIDESSYRVLKGVHYKNGTPPAMVTSTTSLHNLKNQQKKIAGTKEEYSRLKKVAKVKVPRKVAHDENLKSSIKSPKAIPEKLGNDLKPVKTLQSKHQMKSGFLLSAIKTTRKGIEMNGMSPVVTSQEDHKLTAHKGSDDDVCTSITPTFTCSEQGQFELSENTTQGCETLSGSRPKYLIYRIQLPKIQNLSDIDLEVSKSRLFLRSKNSAKSNYHLELKIHQSIEKERESRAKWNKAKSLLTIKLLLQEKRVVEGRRGFKTSSTEGIKSSIKNFGEDDKMEQNSTLDEAICGNLVDRDVADDDYVLVEHPDLPRHCNDDATAIPEKRSDHHSRWVCEESRSGEGKLDFALDNDIPKLVTNVSHNEDQQKELCQLEPQMALAQGSPSRMIKKETKSNQLHNSVNQVDISNNGDNGSNDISTVDNLKSKSKENKKHMYNAKSQNIPACKVQKETSLGSKSKDGARDNVIDFHKKECDNIYSDINTGDIIDISTSPVPEPTAVNERRKMNDVVTTLPHLTNDIVFCLD